jgi:beta-glucuronidase
MLPYPLFPTRTTHDLSGVWDFAFLGDVDLDALDPESVRYNDRLAVPGVYDATPAYAGRRGVACYRTTVPTRPGTAGVLRFGGCGFNTRVFVDGSMAGRCDLPYTGFAVHVPPSTKAGRTLVVAVDNRFDRTRQPLLEAWYDFYLYGGIYRDVTWTEVESECAIERVRVTVEDLARGRVRLDAVLHGRVPTACDMSVSFDGGPAVLVQAVRVQDGVARTEAQVPNPRPWSPQSPFLHTVTVRVDGDAITERFGLRTVRTEGRSVLLNGQPLKLKGYCRHEAHPQFGPALPLMQVVQDLELLRDLGCNFIRGSHYPQDPRFLDLCDEMGFLVWEETLGWGYSEEQWRNPSFLEANLAQIRAMVANSYNHPCIILWGFLNEGASNTAEFRSIYEACARTLRSLDGSRPVTYATNRVLSAEGERCLDLVDVVALNIYPGWYAFDQNKVRPLDEILIYLEKYRAKVAELGQGHKPLLLSEIGAAALYGWRDAMHGHYTEEYQAEYLGIVCRKVMEDADIAGVSLWQFCDCRTFATARALGRPRTFNNKGTFDEYRRPKQAAQVVRSCFQGATAATGN